jgi:hypothetical protein
MPTAFLGFFDGPGAKVTEAPEPLGRPLPFPRGFLAGITFRGFFFFFLSTDKKSFA